MIQVKNIREEKVVWQRRREASIFEVERQKLEKRKKIEEERRAFIDAQIRDREKMLLQQIEERKRKEREQRKYENRSPPFVGSDFRGCLRVFRFIRGVYSIRLILVR